jgi:hypothetical protein
MGMKSLRRGWRGRRSLSEYHVCIAAFLEDRELMDIVRGW